MLFAIKIFHDIFIFLYLLKQNEMKRKDITYMYWRYYNLHTILFIWIEYTIEVSIVVGAIVVVMVWQLNLQLPV